MGYTNYVYGESFTIKKEKFEAMNVELKKFFDDELADLNPETDLVSEYIDYNGGSNIEIDEDDEYGITKIDFEGNNLSASDIKILAKFADSGSYFEVSGEDGERSLWVVSPYGNFATYVQSQAWDFERFIVTDSQIFIPLHKAERLPSMFAEYAKTLDDKVYAQRISECENICDFFAALGAINVTEENRGFYKFSSFDFKGEDLNAIAPIMMWGDFIELFDREEQTLFRYVFTENGVKKVMPTIAWPI